MQWKANNYYSACWQKYDKINTAGGFEDFGSISSVKYFPCGLFMCRQAIVTAIKKTSSYLDHYNENGSSFFGIIF